MSLYGKALTNPVILPNVDLMKVIRIIILRIMLLAVFILRLCLPQPLTDAYRSPSTSVLP